MKSHLIRTLAAAAAAIAAAGAGSAQASPAGPHESCFTPSQWQSWSAAASGDVLYLKVAVNDIYRVDLAHGSGARRDSDKFLVNDQRGSNWICSALDLDLSIADTYGFKKPLIATAMRKLTPAEIALIPRKERP
jgi:hypothetical protein